jgi:glutamate N-acetyltransferase/amino-acid N-acetyltransferase
LVFFEGPAAVSAVFTKSSFRAAPVVIAESRISAGGVRALLINSGNANAATGSSGHEAALGLCDTVAHALGLDGATVAPFSTGVIGEQLPFERMNSELPGLVNSLAADGWLAAAAAILTTDTAPKVISHQVPLGESSVTITGMAKGAGMIKPDMATMLAFICCDAAIEGACLDTLVREVADASFNRITIDGDTSTNDSFVLAATGANNLPHITEVGSPEYAVVKAALLHVARHLAQCIVRDGEGATKFVTVNVTGARESNEALDVAYTIAESPLVKTALFAGDPNWGRLCMAIGRAGVADLDAARVDVYLGELCVVRGGLKDSKYEETAGARVMALDEFEIRVELGRGSADAVIWTSDLSYEYVRINAEYRT